MGDGRLLRREVHALQRRRFERFYRTYTRSEPVKRALKEGFLSAKDPTRALQSILHDRRRAAQELERERQEKATAHLPAPLRAVVDAQLPSGKWPEGDEQLLQVLGSGQGVPDPPEGIVAWKWLCAMCLAFLRRFPAHATYSEAAYERGMFFISDEQVLEQAKERLPPAGLSFRLDPELVRQGKWKDDVRQRMERYGYEAFLYPDGPPAAAPPEASRADEVAQSRPTRTRVPAREASRLLWRAKTLRDIGVSRLKVADAVDFKHGRQTALLRAAAPLEEALPLFSGLADRLAADNEDEMSSLFPGKDLEQVVETGEDAVREAEAEHAQALASAAAAAAAATAKASGEKERKESQDGSPGPDKLFAAAEKETQQALSKLLAESQEPRDSFVDKLASHEAKLGLELRILAKRERLGALQAAQAVAGKWAALVPMKKELARLDAATQPLPRPGWNSGVKVPPLGRALRMRPEPDPPTPRHVIAARELAAVAAREAEAARDDACSSPRLVQESGSRGDAPGASVAEQRRAMETALVQGRLKEHAQRKVQVVLKRLRAYEALLAKLRADLPECEAAYRDAASSVDKYHAFDRVTDSLSKLRQATCAIVEAVESWRKVLNEMGAAQQEDFEPIAHPFVWDGENVLVQLVSRLDFCAASRELRHWYGKKLPMRRNPFMVAVPLDRRPPTPRSALRKVLVDGRQVSRVAPELLAARERDVAAMDAAWEAVQDGPRWWPVCDKETWHRVRMAEKVLLNELERRTDKVGPLPRERRLRRQLEAGARARARAHTAAQGF